MSLLRWGMIGGGEGSQIGLPHRLAARLDGLFDFVAGALDHRPEQGRAYGRKLGLAEDRAYGSWQDMLAGEKNRSGADRLDLITIATPNNTHFAIAKAFLEAGFHVLCEKPLTMTVEEAEEIVTITAKTGVICAVNYGYSGYALVRHMKAMVARGDLGKIRLVKAEFAHGHHADAGDANNARIRWRYDPQQAGVSAQFADCGIHALHMASFVLGQQPHTLAADLVSTVSSRVLEDDAMVNVRMDGGTLVRLWTSSIALGRQHGLALQVFGEKGGLSWEQESPNQVLWTPLGERTQIIERGEARLSTEADNASRMTIGHAEGLPVAFANIYRDLAEEIGARKEGHAPVATLLYPRAEEGLRSVAAIYAAVRSAKEQGAWVDARPAMYR